MCCKILDTLTKLIVLPVIHSHVGYLPRRIAVRSKVDWRADPKRVPARDFWKAPPPRNLNLCVLEIPSPLLEPHALTATSFDADNTITRHRQIPSRCKLDYRSMHDVESTGLCAFNPPNIDLETTARYTASSISPRPPAPRSQRILTTLLSQGESPHAEAPGRLRGGLRQAQDLARPERSGRNLERQLPPDRPQAHRRWPHHPQAGHHALALAGSGAHRCAEDRKAQGFWQEEGY